MSKWMSFRRAGSVLLGLILGSMLLPAAARANPGLIPSTETQIMELANLERGVRGIRPLAHDGRLARWRGNGPTIWTTTAGSTTWTRCPPAASATRPAGRTSCSGCPRSPPSTPIQVMQSDLHRTNLLDPAFSHAAVGMSCATVNGTNFAVAVIEFGADTALSTTVPPAQPQVVQGDIKAGPGVTC